MTTVKQRVSDDEVNDLALGATFRVVRRTIRPKKKGYTVEAVLEAQMPTEDEIRDVRIATFADIRIAESLGTIGRVLAKIERKMGAPRPRITECRHPELHPEIDPDTRARIMGVES